MPSENNGIINLIRSHYAKRSTRVLGEFSIEGMAEFARGVVCVRSQERGPHKPEYDVYFDENLWVFRCPELWQGTGVFPPTLKAHNIGFLPGTGKAPQPQNYREAQIFAAWQLKRRTSPWYSKVIEL
jgi:hypothetical protein